jgi:hypothetical protein
MVQRLVRDKAIKFFLFLNSFQINLQRVHEGQHHSQYKTSSTSRIINVRSKIGVS